MTDLKEISNQIRTQDNRATSDPIFIVQQRHRIYGVDSDHCDVAVWVDEDGNEVPEEEFFDLEEYQSGQECESGWCRVGYLDRWEFVTACFTEEGCKQYIKVNGHNLTEPRIYAASAYRNDEFIVVREWLKQHGETL